MAIDPSDAQVEAFKEAWLKANEEGQEGNRVRAGLRAALNYQPPLDKEDEKYDFALKMVDEVSGDGTYESLNFLSPDPKLQAALQRWRDRGRRS